MTHDRILELARMAGIQEPEAYHGDASAQTPWVATSFELVLFAALILLNQKESPSMFANKEEGQAVKQVPARTVLLREAIKLTEQDRNAAYGNPEDNFANIAAYWNTYLTTLPKQGNILPLTSQDVAHLMILMKVARLNTNPSHRDSLVDIAGYAACGEDCRVKRVSQQFKTDGAGLGR